MDRRSVVQFAGFALLWTASACSSSDSPPGDSEAQAEDASVSEQDAGAVDAADEEPDGAVAVEDAGVVDEGCGLDSGWKGDDQCIKPPDPADGFQLHFGPSDYDDADEVAKYVLMPGEEALLCAYLVTPNDEDVYYSEWLNRLRPGSHHMIVNLTEEAVTEASPVTCSTEGGGASAQGILGGNSTAVAPFEDIAPENAGLARVIPAHSSIEMQLHFFNFGTEPLLMEAWQNVYYMDVREITALMAPIEGYAGLAMQVQPGTTEVIEGAMIAPRELRIVDLYAHHHDHTLRFSAYLRRKDADERTLIYESYDWAHPAYLAYDSVHMNAEPDADARVAGGMSGPLELVPGDTLEWECEILNDDLDFALRFANRAHDAEMCIIRGNYAPSFGSAWFARLP